MVDLKLRHQAQIQLCYENGNLYPFYPFIGNANLSELVQMRLKMMANTDICGRTKEFRQDYFSYLDFVQKAIVIMFSNPDPRPATIKLMYKQQKAVMEKQLRNLRTKAWLKSIPEDKRENIREMLFSLLIKK
jgi:hypothetical protein